MRGGSGRILGGGHELTIFGYVRKEGVIDFCRGDLRGGRQFFLSHFRGATNFFADISSYFAILVTPALQNRVVLNFELY